MYRMIELPIYRDAQWTLPIRICCFGRQRQERLQIVSEEQELMDEDNDNYTERALHAYRMGYSKKRRRNDADEDDEEGGYRD
ncbi:hypothetical protein Pmar_PMAR015553 [Perkinsus marinus ATCC 50983]|uniref:Uncharacterized protein n=1 Tax=Perkinsus marinus (strain ATCC 50983 / TXsc) TaxID=423536 RepID=C5KUF9_PERM5|nr:hypothetical protein Pmar_PMAR015553 [Perkinsus marinus ATCC 50983]EER11846.1 hypothetical protein Pmar_PMAR015553 [Perkinsus marinus ATCC 50983]|eukprot:XP_002780051.1 hypothetical protein Pmar_PMAR015553 [Perkinsus marinus ATCC 50983]